MSHSSTSSSDEGANPLGAFLKRLVLFCLPLAVVLLPPQVALFRVGENWSMARVNAVELERVEAGQETLHQRAYVPENPRWYKFFHLRERAPVIAAVGSSTSMQFRAYAFPGYEDKFYNAGGLTNAAVELDELADWLENVESPPEVLLLGVDPWWFNPQWGGPGNTTLEQLEKQGSFSIAAVSAVLSYREFLKRAVAKRGRGLFDSKCSTPEQEDAYMIGVKACDGSGFRGSDGSRAYGWLWKRERAEEGFEDRSKTLERIEKGTKRFQHAKAVDRKRLEHLERLLEVAKKRDILVAGYLVPLAPEVRGAIAPHAFLGPFFRDYKTSVTALFEAYEMPLVDAQDASALGFSERAFIDGFHASEVVMAVVVEKFFEDPRVVAKLPRLDRAKLRERIRAARSEALFSFDSAEVLTSRGDVARAGAKK